MSLNACRCRCISKFMPQFVLRYGSSSIFNEINKICLADVDPWQFIATPTNDDLKKAWLDPLKQNHPLDLKALNQKEKLAFLSLITKLFDLDDERRKVIINQKSIDRYFDDFVDLFIEHYDALRNNEIAIAVYRLTTFYNKENGNILNNVDEQKLIKLFCITLKHLNPRKSARGFLSICRALHQLVENSSPKISKSLTHDITLRQQLVTGYEDLTKLAGMGIVGRMDILLCGGFLHVLYVLTVVWKISLTNPANAANFLKFLFSNLKQQFDLSPALLNKLQMSSKLTLVYFYEIFQSIHFDQAYSEPVFQNLNHSWVKFWLQKCDDILDTLFDDDNCINENVIESLVEYLLLISLRFKRLFILERKKHQITIILERMSQEKKEALVKKLDQFDFKHGEDQEALNLLNEYLEFLK